MLFRSSRAAQAPRRLALVHLERGQVLDSAIGSITSTMQEGDGDLALALVRRGIEVPGEDALTKSIVDAR